jgi:hypothetical protein
LRVDTFALTLLTLSLSTTSRKLRFSPTLRVVDRYRPELVAFMGWRLAWEGKMRPYPAKQRDSLPLLGLS